MAGENKLFLYQAKDNLPNAAYFNVSERCYDDDPLMIGAFHWHDYFEMEFFFEGEGIHVFNGKTMDVSRGTVYLLTPSDFHTLYRKKEKENLRFFNVNFNEYAISEELIKLAASYGAPMTVKVSEGECEELYREFSSLAAEYEGDSPVREQMMRAIFDKIFIIFWRALEREGGAGAPDKAKRSSAVQYVVNHLRLHFRESVSLASLAHELHLTPNYLGEIFKKETGKTFSDYVQLMRLSYAEKLLLGSELSVLQIGEQSGFHSVSYFIKVFKKSRGQTPLDFRINKRTNEKKG